MNHIRPTALVLLTLALTAPAIAGGSARLVFPNPFTSKGCTFTLTMPESGSVRIIVYDLVGRQVANLTERIGQSEYGAGSHPIFWDGTDGNGDAVPAGTYVCVLSSADGEIINSVKVVRAAVVG